VLVRRIAPLALIAALTAVPAAAQGHGNAAGKGRKTPKAVEPSVGATAIATSGFREFGSWLDDASIVDPGAGWFSVAFGHYNSPGSHQTDFPVADAGIGVNRRLQLGVTLPYSHYGFPDGAGASGRGDVYFNAKIPLKDPATAPNHRGFALTPLVEVLSEPDPINGRRVFWGIPISAEVRAERARLYGSTGYFSRGVFFGSGAVELPATDRIITTAALTWAHSFSSDVAAETTGLAATRVDLTGGAAFVLTPKIVAFGSVGRTVSHVDANSSTLMLNGGLSFSFSTAPPARRR